MSFSPSQQRRILLEKNLLDKYFPHRVNWYTPNDDDAYVEVKMVSNSSRQYTLRSYISCDFPNSCPEMVMVSPASLSLKNGSPLPNISHEYHTIGRKDGYLLLCHFIPSQWTAENTLYQVFMKGRLWIEAYEGHLDTGKKMDVFLKAQREAAASGCVVS